MKKAVTLGIAMLLVLIFDCVGLAACDPGHFSFESNLDVDEVTSIEMIDYNNPKQKRFASRVAGPYVRTRAI